MSKTYEAVAVFAFALTVLLFASGAASAADKGPIVHDYSKSGASDYHAPQKQSAGNAAGSSASGPSSGGAGGQQYQVNCKGKGPCKVGHDVMLGYETFGGHCARCHGENAEGSTFAPSLVDRLKGGLGQGQFTAAVAGGMTKMDTTTGTYKVMPAWGSNPDVMNHVTQIWAYLKARSDGGLSPGRPKAMGKASDKDSSG